MITERKESNSLNSTFINKQENLNGIRNLTLQDIETPSHFINEERVKTMPTTTRQIISPIHPTLTTPHNKYTSFPETTSQRRKLTFNEKQSVLNCSFCLPRI